MYNNVKGLENNNALIENSHIIYTGKYCIVQAVQGSRTKRKGFFFKF